MIPPNQLVGVELGPEEVAFLRREKPYNERQEHQMTQRLLNKLQVALRAALQQGNEILTIAEWIDFDGEPKKEWFVEFYTSHRQDTWRSRLRAAWLSLCGVSYYHDLIWSATRFLIQGGNRYPKDREVLAEAHKRGEEQRAAVESQLKRLGA